jgi:Xaa-Pro aminopeptidase
MWDPRAVDTPQATHFSSGEHVSRHLAQIAAERRFPARRVGYEGSFEFIAPPVIVPEPVVPAEPSKAALAAAFPDAELVDATGVLDRIRAFKTSRDVALLRRANEVNAFGLEAWRDVCVAEGTEAEAAAAYQAAVTARGIGYQGARFAMGWPQVFSGEWTESWVYKPTTDRRMRPGDLVIIELACSVDGYYVDLTRTIVVGTPSAAQQELADACDAGMAAAIATAGPGVPAADVDRAAREAMGGYREHMLHHVGHGLGWKYHEPIPTVTPASEDVLEPGMYFAVEPAAYVPGVGGVRNEHNLLVTGDGVEILSDQFPIGLVDAHRVA